MPSSVDSQLCFLQKDQFPSMFILLVLLFFFPACLPLATKAEVDKGCFSLARLFTSLEGSEDTFL